MGKLLKGRSIRDFYLLAIRFYKAIKNLMAGRSPNKIGRNVISKKEGDCLKIIKRLVLLLLGIFVFVVIWGLVEPYFVKVREERAAIPNLPAAWEGKEIAVIGDFQIGMWMDNDSTVKEMSERIVEMDPQAVLFLGDYIYHSVDSPAKERERVKELVQPLVDAEIPIFAVLGNHDFAMASKQQEPNEDRAQDVVGMLRELGITVLENEAVPLTLSADGVEQGTESPDALYIAGLGAAWPDKADPSKTFQEVPDDAARFVMMHNPETFGTLPAETAPVAVAGHTHGGQMKIPYTPEWSYTALMTENEDDHIYGWIDDYGASGNELYINPGVGFSTLPLRINCMPEITVFKLVAE